MRQVPLAPLQDDAPGQRAVGHLAFHGGLARYDPHHDVARELAGMEGRPEQRR
jgi:hypothetical protein